jgi:hypothetical protein
MAPLFVFAGSRILRIITARASRNLVESTAKNQACGGSVIPLGRAQAEPADPRLLSEERIKPHLRAFFWCLVIALGALQVWAHRNDVSPDGISYIEMAEAAGRSGWHALVNGYWSPLYPALLSIVFRISHPAVYWEFPVVHVVNFALYLAGLFCFEIFLKELLAERRIGGGSEKGPRQLPEKIVWTWGYLLFLWASQFWLGPAMTNPDIIVAGLVYVATALLLWICQGKGNWLLFAGLGAVLGFGYLAKAAMFPISFAFLTSAFLLFGVTRKSYLKALARSVVALAVFVAIATP